MKKPMVLCAFLATALLVIVFSGFGQEKYTPKPNEEIYGTWVNEQINPPKTAKNPDGTFANYFPASFSKPFQGGKSEIFKKWTDSEGNVYYDTFDTFTFGSSMINKAQCLWKVSKSGTVLEQIWVSVSDFAPDKFPTFETKIDNMTTGYLIYYRAKE